MAGVRGKRTAVVGLTLYLGFLFFPHPAQAGPIGITWTGADTTNPNSYSDPNNWSCSGHSCAAYPNDLNGGPYDVTINTLNGSDLVNLGNSPVTIDSLTLGGISSSSTLNTGFATFTVGTSTSPDTVLTIGSGGTLNVQAGLNAVINTTESSADLALGLSNAGAIAVGDYATLTLRDTSGALASIGNNGAITLGTSAGANLVLDSANTFTTFDIVSTSAGTLNLIGGSTISGASGAETMVNDAGHTINVDADGSTGTSTISGLANFTNIGTINIGVSGTTPSAAVSLVVDTTSSSGGFSNAGSIYVNDGTQLIFKNTNAGTAQFENNGTITLGTSTGGASLKLNGTSDAVFDLTGASGTGVVSMNGLSQISGATGAESLINDVGHTISNYGTGSISGLASFTNNGTLSALSGVLTIDSSANLSNWNSGSKTLSGGSYSVAAGATLQLSVVGSPGISTLSGANVTVNSTGLLTGDGTHDAIQTVTSIQNSNLTLKGVGTSQHPYTFGALTLSAASTGSISSACGTSGSGSALCIENQSAVTAASLLTQATGAGSHANVVVDNSTLNIGSLIMTTAGGQSLVLVKDGGNLLVGTSDGVTGGSGSELTLGGAGTVSIGKGATLSIDNGSGSFFLEGGDLTGGGTLEANLDQTGGTLNPGDPQSIDITGSYDQQAGILAFDLMDWANPDNGDYDQIDVTNAVTLDGTLAVDLLDPDFAPALGDVFDVVNSQTGTITLGQDFAFDNVVFDNGLETFALSLNGLDQLDLTVVSRQSATPEPGTLSLLLGAMLIGGLLYRRRSCRRFFFRPAPTGLLACSPPAQAPRRSLPSADCRM